MSSSSMIKSGYRRSGGASHGGVSRTTVRKRVSTSSSTGSMGHMTPLHFREGVISSISQRGTTDIKHTREKEKKEMQDLNERFANYIEKVRFLEAENNALKEELKKNKRDFNIEPMKAMYQSEIDEIKKHLLITTDENAALKARISTLEDETDSLNGQCRHLKDMNDQQQNTIENLNDDIARRIAECEMLRRKVQELEKQLADWKARYAHLDSQLQALRIELQEETSNRLSESTRAQALEDELNFLKDIYETEIKEYKALLAKDSSFPDMREYWTSELGSCLKEIRQEYESQLEALSASLESRYESQISEIRMGTTKENVEMTQLTEENRRLRSQKTDLEDRLRDLEAQLAHLNSQVRSLTNELDVTMQDLDSEKESHRNDVDKLQLELELMMKELQDLMDAKLSMELEIAAYRKLLEGEESRISLGGVVHTMGGYHTSSEEALSSALAQRSSSGFKSSMSAEGTLTSLSKGRLTINRSASGPVSIVEVESNGQYIALEETGRIVGRQVNIKGWTLERTIEGKKVSSHTFKDDVMFPNKITIKVWCSKHGSNASKNDVVANNVHDWGSAHAVSKTILKDENNMEKAQLNVRMND